MRSRVVLGSICVLALPVAAWTSGCVGDAPVVGAGDGGAADATIDVSQGAGDAGADTAVGVDASDSSTGSDAGVDSGPTCAATELLCDGGCIQNTASNCGGCGTACAPDGGAPYCSPTSDAGTTYACTSGCAASLALCGTSCVNEQTDKDNCGGCGASYACKAGQECSGGHCVCDATSCPNGCCSASGQCITAPACGTAGATCASGCPLTLPEASSMALWLVGDDYVPPPDSNTAVSWMDRSGNGANATCPLDCATSTGTVNSHKSVYFTSSNFFSITDPNADLQSNQWSILLVVKPNTQSPKYTPIFALAVSASKYISFIRPLTDTGALSQDIQLGVYPGSLTQDYFASLPTGKAWADNWERVISTIDPSGNAIMGVYNNALGVSGQQSGTIGPATMTNTDYNHSAVGANTDSFGQPFFIGEIAEIIVFRQVLSVASQTSVNTYLTGRYNF